ncbi:MAG: hypothetical protein EA412_08945 [Chitinophagaceae bacterium]|nr:MAG: hypothetical protein EA412_08945 [Chitinophagaceae bacterium]
MKLKIFLIIISAIFLLESCVPAQKLDDERKRTERLESENTRLVSRVQNLEEDNKEKSMQVAETQRAIQGLVQDTTSYGLRYRRMREMNDDLNRLYEEVIEQNKNLLQTSSSEQERLTRELDNKIRELNEKSKDIQKQENELLALQQSVQQQRSNIDDLNVNLKEREKRVEELESLIAKQDSATKALRENIAQSLLGFDKEDLTVEVRDGKIYVSLAEQLLFQSGSIQVDPKGVRALKSLAEVLSRQEDVSIMIEGHTDNVPIRTSCIKDNWDLSVLRATSIIRILTENTGLDSQRVIASGRGEHLPVATNEDRAGRSLNRRTEIIVAPDLDQVFQLLESN